MSLLANKIANFMASFLFTVFLFFLPFFTVALTHTPVSTLLAVVVASSPLNCHCRYAEGKKGSDTAEVAPVTKTSRQYTSSSSKSNGKGGAANALLDETVDV